ncbi:MAG: glucose-1-phosphate thymidylyltransferase [Rickettsiales bacterium]|nr:glucose-1-phosphate thymidylyltransferase [Rickettsiales bacterium]|tara:strand:- start:1100 stop:1972 length:873 start_codon:yes stop_codon:yes gene_type:complete
MNFKKAIIIAGGSGSRLNPITNLISKQSLPIYDKPMIYYPLSIIMLLKIKDILVITNKESNLYFKKLLGNGSKFGIKIKFKIQHHPKGIAHAIKISEKFINKKNICVILGDNIFYGQSLIENIKSVTKNNQGASIFGYYMNNPNKYGVIKINNDNKITGITEKPRKIISNYAIPGLYFFDQNLIKYVKKIKPSKRKELEVVDLLKEYLRKNKLNVKIFGRGLAWLDTGNADNLLTASNFIKTIEDRQGIKVACLEEIALNNKWITKNFLRKSLKKINQSVYFDYIRRLVS